MQAGGGADQCDGGVGAENREARPRGEQVGGRELGVTDDRLTSVRGQIFLDGVVPGRRECVGQLRQDGQQGDDGGDRAGGVRDERADAKREQADDNEVQNEADDGPDDLQVA